MQRIILNMAQVRSIKLTHHRDATSHILAPCAVIPNVSDLVRFAYIFLYWINNIDIRN